MTLFKYSMKKAIKYILILFSIVIMLLCGNSNTLLVHAQKVNEYSDVFDDLRQDPNFKAEDYPSMTLDYWNTINKDTITDNDQAMIEVIGIAESSDDELYIYTYQPLNYDLELTATAISMSLGYSKDGQDLQPKIYDLYLASSYGVYNKYVVEKLDVSDEPYRYYNIVTIYRSHNSTIDWQAPPSGAEAFGNEYGIGVGQQWCAYYQNDTIVYEMGTFEIMEIKVDFVGSLEFSSGYTLGGLFGSFDYNNLWFIAFHCDEYKIKHIYDADMEYKMRGMSYSVGMGLDGTKTYYPMEHCWDNEYGIHEGDADYETGGFTTYPVTLKDTDKPSWQGDGLRAREYKWDTISTADDFIKNAKENNKMSLSDEIVKALETNTNEQPKWVFAFATSELDTRGGYGATSTFGYDVSHVTILRIHFVDIHGDVYNLGVVSDRVNPDNEADGSGGGIDTEAMTEWFEKLLMLIGVVLLVIALGYFSPIFSVIFNVLIKCITWSFKGILLIISAPFKLIGNLFKPKKRK